jgi:hypothetical protein
MNDQAHCLKCQKVIKVQPSIHGWNNPTAPEGIRRKPGEASTFKYAPSCAMESTSGQCAQSPDGVHHWRFGKCSFCNQSQGKLVSEAGAIAYPAGAVVCTEGGKHMFKFAKCIKCGRREF